MKTVQVGSMVADGGRHGVVEAPEQDFRVSFREADGSELAPEHLFAGAYAACFHSSLSSAAERGHIEIPGLTVTANVALEEDAQGDWNLAIELRCAMPGVNRGDAEHLMHLAHQSCPYSKALRGRARVDLTLD